MMKKNRLLMVATFMLPLLFFCLSGNGQGNSISGIVTDETNNPMPGVNVVIKGTTTGTVANPDGE